MIDSAPAPTAAPLPSAEVPPPSKLTQILQLPRVKLLTGILLASLFLIVASLLLNLRTREQVSYQQPKLLLPSPSPKIATRFATDPTVLEAEQIILQAEASASSLIIEKHPLLPPSLDMEVTLEE